MYSKFTSLTAVFIRCNGKLCVQWSKRRFQDFSARIWIHRPDLYERCARSIGIHRTAGLSLSLIDGKDNLMRKALYAFVQAQCTECNCFGREVTFKHVAHCEYNFCNKIKIWKNKKKKHLTNSTNALNYKSLPPHCWLNFFHLKNFLFSPFVLCENYVFKSRHNHETSINRRVLSWTHNYRYI